MSLTDNLIAFGVSIRPAILLALLLCPVAASAQTTSRLCGDWPTASQLDVPTSNGIQTTSGVCAGNGAGAIQAAFEECVFEEGGEPRGRLPYTSSITTSAVCIRRYA